MTEVEVRRELLIGCGNSAVKRLSCPGHTEWSGLIRIDIDKRCDPDIVHDANDAPYPFESNQFDEIHAYEVLEHLGQQGDYVGFFSLFSEFWRILKPGGMLMATVPSTASMWAWGDPGHTRIISLGTLSFLSQSEYARQVGKTNMTDYRRIYRADFDVIYSDDDGDTLKFVLKANKPALSAKGDNGNGR